MADTKHSPRLEADPEFHVVGSIATVTDLINFLGLRGADADAQLAGVKKWVDANAWIMNIPSFAASLHQNPKTNM